MPRGATSAYQGEKQVSLKLLNQTPMESVKISLNMSSPRVACGKENLTASQIISRHFFGYFSSVQCGVSAAKK